MKRFFFILLALSLLTLPCLAADPVTIADGVTLEQRRITLSGTERDLCFLTVDPAKAEFRLATPGDDPDNDGGGGRGASLLDMAKAAESDTRHIVAAVNGDFYKTGSDGGAEYAPFAALGVMVKDGAVISEGQRAEGAAFFGITKDGQAVIGSAEAGGEFDVLRDELVTAIGGELLLIRNGRSNLADVTWRTDSSTLAARYGSAGRVYDESGALPSSPGALSYYPRTCIGITGDGKVVILAASVGYGTPGLSVAELTELMLAEGCTDMMNLDGGPSTQMAADCGSGLQQLVTKGISARIGDGLLIAAPQNAAAVSSSDPGALVLAAICLAVVLAAGLLFLLFLRRKKR